jgi:hypothetical protein
MAALHSLLALYGAFDQSVVEADDPAWTARVEHFLPGFDGLNERGWFSEVKGLVSQLAPDTTAAQFPDVRSALDELTQVANVISGFADPRTPLTDNDPPLLTTTDIAQLLYIFAVGITLAPEAPRTRSVDLTPFLVLGGETVEPILGLASEPRANIYRAAGRFSPRTSQSRAAQASDLFDVISGRFTGHRSWPHVMTHAFDQNAVSREVATAPIVLAGITAGASHPDKGSHAAAAVTQVDGQFCAVLTTNCWEDSSGLTVDAVKAIVDPRNWARLSEFFCQIDALQPDARGASQVLEHVSTDKKNYQLKTALKNWRKNFGGGGILNYELADKRDGTGDSGLILLDNGYIHISDNKLGDGTIKGVRIKTSKMVAIQGVSVTAVAMFTISLGWAAVSNAMLFDNAVNQPKGDPLVGWKESPETVSGGSGGVPPGGASGQPPPGPQIPVGASAVLIKEAASMWADCVEATANDATNMMSKWYKGQLTMQDVVDYTSAVGGRLASEPWRYLNRVSKQVPATPSPPSTTPSPPSTPQDKADKAEGGSS